MKLGKGANVPEANIIERVSLELRKRIATPALKHLEVGEKEII